MEYFEFKEIMYCTYFVLQEKTEYLLKFYIVSQFDHFYCSVVGYIFLDSSRGIIYNSGFEVQLGPGGEAD